MTGIDCLATLAARHRAHVHRVLTVADPTAMITATITALTGWPLINLITVSCSFGPTGRTHRLHCEAPVYPPSS